MADPLRYDGRAVAVVGEAAAIADRFREAGARVVDDIGTAGDIDVVVCRMGPPLGDQDGPAVVARNLLGPIAVAQQAHAAMAAGGGVIVFVVGLAAVQPSPGTAAYGAAEAGVVNLATTLALEWGPAIRVNCVSADSTDAAAGPCLFLASEDASHVNGETLVVDDGGEPPAYLAAATGG
jgi:NAD(P)-dependent dehydrogenase (short-subunit alcohol dehydrogenase family)